MVLSLVETRKAVSMMWATLVVLSALSVWVYMHAWSLDFYEVLLVTLGVASMLLAIGVVAISRPRVVSIPLATLAIVVGQWWFFERLAIYIVWMINGMAA